MERAEVFDLMGALKLYGMRAAYDEVMAAGIKRQHEPPRIVGDLLKAEIAEKQARSIKYQLTISPSCRWPRISATSGSTARRSTRHCCASWQRALSLPSSAMLSSSVAQEPARAISPLPSRRPASAAEPGGRFYTVVDL